MYKLYRVQSFNSGVWSIGMIPYVGEIEDTHDIDRAKALIEIAKFAYGISNIHEELKPTEWRIISLELPEWKPEYHCKA